jgi:TRAP-type C4-dicarboxylate transport system substrate-binding protein
MKFFEVGHNLDDRARYHHPADLLLRQDLQLPPDLQQAIIKAGKEAGAHGRQIESSEDAAKLDALEKAGKLKRVAFTDRAEMKKLVDPVMAAYAKEIGADKIYAEINAIP